MNHRETAFTQTAPQSDKQPGKMARCLQGGGAGVREGTEGFGENDRGANSYYTIWSP